MRNAKQIDAEINKLRILIKLDVSEEVKGKAWASMLALQWAKTTPKDCSLSPMELTGITMVQAQGVSKMAKRTRLT